MQIENLPEHRKKIIEEMARLKQEKTENWKQSVKGLLRYLWKVESKFDQEEMHGTEAKGRPAIISLSRRTVQ